MKIYLFMVGGVVMVIGGIALRLGAHPDMGLWQTGPPPRPAGFSLDTYDMMRLGSWALLVAGGVVVAASLIAYWRTSVK